MLFASRTENAVSPVRSVEFSFDWLWLELAAGRTTDLKHYLNLAEDTLRHVKPSRRA